MVNYMGNFRLEPVDEWVPHNAYNLFFKNNELGRIIRDVDGWFYFWPKESGGCWSGHTLSAIADILVKLNKDWDEQVNNDPNITL